MKYSLKHTALAVALAGTFGVANATLLLNDSVTTSVDVVGTFFGGTLLDSAVTAISAPGYSGTARTAVYRSETGLDFYYQFSNNADSLTGIKRFVGFDFSGLGTTPVNVYQTAAAFGIFEAGVANAEGADRGPLNVVGFDFVPDGQSKIMPGETSFTQILRTSSQNYTPGNFGIINGTATNAPGFAITAAVPEPESFAMLLAGLGLMGTIARRRSRKGS